MAGGKDPILKPQKTVRFRILHGHQKHIPSCQNWSQNCAPNTLSNRIEVKRAGRTRAGPIHSCLAS